MPPVSLVLRFRSGRRRRTVPAVLIASDAEAAPALDAVPIGRTYALLAGFPDYAVWLDPAPDADTRARLERRVGRSVLASFASGQALRRTLAGLATGVPASTGTPVPGPASAVHLNEGLDGAAPLWLHADGRLSTGPDAVPEGLDARDTLVTAARWVSSRRTTRFERLFPADPFHPERPARTDALTPVQADGLLGQLERALEAAVDPAHAQLRSAAATVLAHLVATGPRASALRDAATRAADRLLALAEAEPVGALRGHLVHLLQLRGPALAPAQQERARALVRALVRPAPPYDALPGDWRFAMCSAWDFHDGECQTLVRTHGFTERAEEGPYRVFEAPFRTPAGGSVQIHARRADPADEHREMGDPRFQGLLVNRHAQLGAFDMRAATLQIRQEGYKLMMNSQCAGLTTRFAITRLFPDADVWSSWDSTYFRTDADKVLVASEGLDCFVALLRGMCAREDHARLSDRVRAAQWHHPQAAATPGFVQFLGPAHPLVLARFDDVNRDGRADAYDGFLDLELAAIAEDVSAGSSSRDPGVPPSAISGEAADGLGWAVGSMNRVAQYSDLWAALPGRGELLYPFRSGGFFDPAHPPLDVAVGPLAEDLARLPAVARVTRVPGPDAISVEVLFHARLAHAGRELKRLLVAAECLNRLADLGHLDAAGVGTPLARRGMLLLTLAGLLDYPADQNRIDALWSAALRLLNLPDLSRSSIRAHNTAADHDASNYYGSRRGLAALTAALHAGDPVVYARLVDPDPTIGRALPLGP